jgi:hypothetical protein
VRSCTPPSDLGNRGSRPIGTHRQTVQG